MFKQINHITTLLSPNMATSATGLFVFPANRKLQSSSFIASLATKQSSVHVKQEVNGFVGGTLAATKRNVSERLGLKDYFELSAELVATSDGGPPRWFSPLECGCRTKDSPLLLFLPGVDGTGLGLMLHHQRLGEFFDIWCLHIPITDRTSFIDLVKLVEGTVREEYSRSPNRPIYLVAETVGACLALAVAARNPDIDLILILANPATSPNKAQFQPQTLMPLSRMVPQQLLSYLPQMLLLVSGSLPEMVAAKGRKGLPFEQLMGELSGDSVALLSYLSVLSNVSTAETIEWKLNMVKSAAAFANSRLHAVKAQTLLLTSGNDKLFASKEEGERLKMVLPKCELREFDITSHALFLQEGINMASVIVGASFYRRGKSLDYVLDFIPPTPSEFRSIYDKYRWIDNLFDPVMISTTENGEIMRNLDGIPQEGPVLFVGYHMLLGVEIYPLVNNVWTERNILLRGIAHPWIFSAIREDQFPPISAFDSFRGLGAVPVSAANFYKLFSSKSHILLYPGGAREALHRKGEEYKLFWPEQSEFVRMAAKFGATIVPFGSVGEDDAGQLLLDYNDLSKIPFIKDFLMEKEDEAVNLRSDTEGEVANQPAHVPVILPKIPGRFYYYFGKPIHLKGKEQDLKSRESAQEMYLEVKHEVEKCISYLKEKRESDPYRSIVKRLAYRANHGPDSRIPTFDL